MTSNFKCESRLCKQSFPRPTPPTVKRLLTYQPKSVLLSKQNEMK